MLPPGIEDFVPQGHLARVVNDVVETIDVSEIEKRYSLLGQKSYHPHLLLKVLFYGYCTGVDLSLGGGDLKVGLRGVGEIKFGDYGSVEVNGGARVTLQWPAVIQAMLNSSEIK